MKRLCVLLIVILAAQPAYAQTPPACTEAQKKEIQVELDGIDAIRKIGIGGVSLNALRGVCTPIRSVEGSLLWIAEPIIRKALELLKTQGFDLTNVDLHVISNICKNLHHYTDEFAVGKRERELKERLTQCK